MTTDQQLRALRRLLFPAEEGLFTYAVLDGASVTGLPGRLAQDRPEHVCLYRGKLESDLAECAPYLVRLLPGQGFADWVMTEGWGKHWGIFALAPVGMEAMRRHLRTFVIVKDPDGRHLYFRYYDPRVLPVYLPTCNAAEARAVFGPVQCYAMEASPPDTLLRFASTPTGVTMGVVSLAAGGM